MPRRRNKASQQTSMQPENAIEDLLAEADKHIDEFEFEIALGFCERALRMDQNNVRALETCSNVLLEVGRLKKAKEICLAKAVDICPDVGHSKYFSLAQLSEGKTAVSLYNKGIELVKKELEFAQEGSNSSINLENSATVSKTCVNLRRKISNAFCSIVEIFMTDLCDEEDAEEQCSLNIEHALSSDETNPEVYQCKASFVMIRQNVEEARQLMLKSLSLWLPQKKQPDESSTNEECSLSFEARLNSSKLLIELKEFDTAAEVLADLQVEDDECIEVWYLEGLLNYLKEGDEETKKEAKFYFQAALNLFQKFGVSEEEVEMQNHVLELLEELKDVILDDDAEDEENKENENDSEISSSENEEEMET